MFETRTNPAANLKNDLLSGLTVALVQVPEAVAFAFVAGVTLLAGLYAAFIKPYCEWDSAKKKDIFS